MTSVYRVLESPIGPLTLVGDLSHEMAEGKAVLRAIWFSSSKKDEHLDPNAAPPSPPEGAVPDEDALEDAARQLAEFFEGKRREFDLPLDPIGTEFQRRVWAELSRIPYGEAISYRELAGRVGNPNAVRAVGSANGKNPIPIVIPCHRVIASDGTLAGFGGGIPAKQFLLDLEGVRIPSAVDQMSIGVPGSGR